VTSAADRRQAVRKSGLVWLGAAVVIVAVGRSSNLEILNVGALTAIWALWSSSLNVVWGYGGDFSMAQIGLGAVGAYMEAVLVTHYGWPFWAALGGAVGAAVVVGFVIGVVAARLSGFYFSIMTLAFGLALLALVPTLAITGQSTGLPTNIAPGTIRIGGLEWNLASRRGGYFLLCALVLVVVLFLVARLVKSPRGRAMVAVREDPVLATSVAIDVGRTRLVAFVLGAVIAGIAGVLYGGYLGFIFPSLFTFSAIITMIVQVVLGGRGFLIGPLIGAAIYVVLTDWVRFGGQYSDGVFGLLLVVIILFAPKGLCGLGADAIDAFRRRREAGRAGTSLASGNQPGSGPTGTGPIAPASDDVGPHHSVVQTDGTR
jgi:branched-chain amino acid transport system permease protein